MPTALPTPSSSTTSRWAVSHTVGPGLSAFQRSLLLTPAFCCSSSLQDLLDQEKAEMELNRIRERSTRSFNFGAYHTLETVGPLCKTTEQSGYVLLCIFNFPPSNTTNGPQHFQLSTTCSPVRSTAGWTPWWLSTPTW